MKEEKFLQGESRSSNRANKDEASKHALDAHLDPCIWPYAREHRMEQVQ